MTQEKFGRDQLVQKIVRAQVKLESMLLKHKDSCAIETDPIGFASCSCGANNHNSKVRTVLAELSLD